MQKNECTIQDWIQKVVVQNQIDKYKHGHHFIHNDTFQKLLQQRTNPTSSCVRDILQKSLSIQTLSLQEISTLMQVEDPILWNEMFEVAEEVKKKVYDNRIVTFAPLYMSNLCVNNCEYCGFKKENSEMKRIRLSMDEIREEIKILAGCIGHKRLISVVGEHPLSDVDYIVESLNTIYSVKEKTPHGYGNIRRVNINAAPMSIEDLGKLKKAGIGTFQVFQETYHQPTYEKIHPQDTIKGNYEWRLYCMHRAQEAGVDDVGIGALFGLYDWRYEILGLVAHSIELETEFGIGPHTISVPRLQPASHSELSIHSRYRVNDEDFRKIVVLIRLAVPYTGLIITARESPTILKEMYPIMTQRDASTNIKIGGYEKTFLQEEEEQQFMLGDDRSLDEVVRELANEGHITSFCTAGYRCGRTGKKIMNLLRCGREGQFCKLNAILTFREWLDDFASPETKQVGEKIILKELKEVENSFPSSEVQELLSAYEQVKQGVRDLYF
ncbi:MAG: [FeFe] hydrogenase H-cluster radical SAM maturase HydG [Caldisericia bacterium]|nr:[FeFe] hydrogenase H-cluster radical SAM maturase HydG [Caldisericia bacterium]MDD4614232.1 [FeFe] hydrogenase H-cluster radical SAM maturase HydG [Caldisericia bacterium]